MSQPLHPGKILLQQYLKPLNLSQKELASKLGLDIQTINSLVNSRRSITPRVAIKLSQVLKTTPEYWLHLQSDYDLWIERQET